MPQYQGSALSDLDYSSCELNHILFSCPRVKEDIPIVSLKGVEYPPRFHFLKSQ